MLHHIENRNIHYTIRFSLKAKSARIVLKPNAFEVVLPKGLKETYAHEFVLRKKSWMTKHAYLIQKETKNFTPSIPLPKSNNDILELKRNFKKKIISHITKHHQNLGRPNQVKLKKMTSRWGSLSSKKNMNINWLLAFAPDETLEYVVVHELCHLTHMNHSASFWQLVEANYPSYKQGEAWLKKHGNTLLNLPIPQ